MKKLFLLLLAVTIGLCASAQMRTVHGTVVDANTQEELIGVSVKAGPNYGVATDASGEFSLRIPESVKTLTVSYVGYQTVDVPVEDGNMRINLVPDNALLDPVIVVAYGEQKRSSFTGSAATVGAATIEKTQVTNALDALSGKVAGLQLSNASGAPGASSPTIRIRGFSSILAGNAPLVIVDGAPFSGDINTINTNDIESMSVLKDAASNALYGARGANGVHYTCHFAHFLGKHGHVGQRREVAYAYGAYPLVDRALQSPKCYVGTLIHTFAKLIKFL